MNVSPRPNTGAAIVILLATTLLAGAVAEPQAKADNIVTGTVVDPDGQPASGVRVMFVALTPAGEDQVQALEQVTDSKGGFAFPPAQGEYWLFASGKAGSAELHVEEPQPQVEHRLELRPWGRVAGVLLRGKTPMSGETVTCYSDADPPEGMPLIQFREQARTDEHGRFVFERVPPGGHTVGHLIVLRVGRSRMFVPSHTTPATVRSGETTKVTVGGNGRPVVGAFAGETPVDFTLVHASLVVAADADGGTARREYFVRVDADGTFRAEDVPEGIYTLKLVAMPMYAGPDERPPEFRLEPDEVAVPTIEAGDFDEPREIGTVHVAVE